MIIDWFVVQFCEFLPTPGDVDPHQHSHLPYHLGQRQEVPALEREREQPGGRRGAGGHYRGEGGYNTFVSVKKNI